VIKSKINLAPTRSGVRGFDIDSPMHRQFDAPRRTYPQLQAMQQPVDPRPHKAETEPRIEDIDPRGAGRLHVHDVGLFR
jgi:hypothetical protein